ncbi:MAG: pentapeptide repeat-containing protein [Geminicoccaceae bacterium]
MIRLARVSGLACAIAAVAGPALADCSDVPQPDVYWRRCLQDGQDLSNVDLTRAILRDASFKRSDLSGATLVGVDARRAKFISSTLRNAVLDRANLVRADLTSADLTGASLKDADLTWTKLYGANLSGADLTGARIKDTDLLKAVLDDAIWIDGVTICAEGSVGQCHPGRKRREISETDPRS